MAFLMKKLQGIRFPKIPIIWYGLKLDCEKESFQKMKSHKLRENTLKRHIWYKTIIQNIYKKLLKLNNKEVNDPT